MYEFYEEPRHLNKKKIIILAVIFFIIVITIIVLIAKKISTPVEQVETPTVEKTKESSTTFYDNNKSVCIELSDKFHLSAYKTNPEYLIELRSDNNLNIFVSKKDMIENKSLSDVIEADKLAFVGDFDTCSNLSETKELYVDNNITYTYSFHYLDKTLNEAFYLQVVWLQIDNTYYIFDIEFPLDDLTFNTNIVADVLSNFKVL